jgi:hypothetical protein
MCIYFALCPGSDDVVVKILDVLQFAFCVPSASQREIRGLAAEKLVRNAAGAHER